MKRQYGSEIEGMIDFYKELNIIPDYSCNTDGRIKGTLIEFKLNNNELPIKQLQRYINSFNILALPIPAYSLFVNINQRKYVFIDNREWKKSKINNRWEFNIDFNQCPIEEGEWENPEDLQDFFEKNEYLKGWIDEFSIVSYNDLFYKNHSAVKKSDFIEEIEDPKELNIESYYWNKTGNMERSMLDCLGGKELLKRLGAFFTPDEYVKISNNYLRKAIKKIPEGYDYIILDRCAGSGNLEKFLSKNELSHCILNTCVYSEWITLSELYKDRVRKILPCTKEYTDPDGLLRNGDALSEKFNNMLIDIIKKERKKANGKLIVIGLENPPYLAPQSEAARGGKTTKKTVKFISKLMHISPKISGAMINDLSSQFIWSMLNLYKPDNYIVYAPIKVWKNHEKFITTNINNLHLCNRKKFHATEAAIGLFNISNNENNQKTLSATSDIYNQNIIIKQNHYQTKPHKLLDPKSVDNSYAEIIHTSGTPDFKNACLVNTKQNKCGRHIKMNNFNVFQALPLWVANCYKTKDYTEKEVIMKSGDGGIEYQKDKNFLNDCFIYSCLTNKNKCISNNQIKNELCLNQNTEADKLFDKKKKHNRILKSWNEIINFVETTEEYNSNFNYGLDQIIKEINIKIDTGRCNKKNEPIMIYKYPILYSLIQNFKILELNNFYEKYITPKLFKYELLK